MTAQQQTEARAVAKPLTARQAEMLDLIRRFIDDRRVSPTRRELGTMMGIVSTNAVEDHLRVLERRGYLKVGHAMARGIALTELGGDYGEKCQACGQRVRTPSAGASA